MAICPTVRSEPLLPAIVSSSGSRQTIPDGQSFAFDHQRPLRPVRTMPCIKYFWEKANSTITGIVIKVEAAIMAPVLPGPA